MSKNTERMYAARTTLCTILNTDASLEEYEKCLKNIHNAACDLLAIIHKDGGHHRAAVGFFQALKNAERTVYEMHDHCDRLRVALINLVATVNLTKDAANLDNIDAAIGDAHAARGES